ncbi:hypothetical protein O9K51_09954 [Purpureocillium lavendulum]|uniref:Uncharacterized protein n=1 Tax=Purpureocillium lavendulum TaxID=1247861 RepID=A0AB34FD80_9HYPO|nr:hypothetical protein O9K51_09954 [Purpureocillium lavendulum]
MCPTVDSSRENCTFQTPILDAHGEPFSEVRVVEFPERPIIVCWSDDCETAYLNNGGAWEPRQGKMLTPGGHWSYDPYKLLPKMTKCEKKTRPSKSARGKGRRVKAKNKGMEGAEDIDSQTGTIDAGKAQA